MDKDILENAYNWGLDLLSELIKIPSVSPQGDHYEEIAELLAHTTESLGFDTQIIKVDKDYQEQNCKHASRNPRYIVLATYGSNGPVLHFNGHYDVVPGGIGWTITEPFKPFVKDNKLYGRGAIDMKGGIAAVLAGLKAFKDSNGYPDNLVLQLAFVPDEEIGGECGTGYLVERVLDQAPEYVIIPEPSGLKTPWHGHKGALWAKIRVHGKNAHASTPWQGKNAFLLASKFALELHSRYTTILSTRRTKYKITPPEASYPTVMIGGVARVVDGKTNQVPGLFEFTIDRRLIPEENVESTRGELEALLRWISVELGIENYEISYETSMEPAINDPAELYEALKESGKKYDVIIGEPEVCPGGLDLRYYTLKGSKALSYGPTGTTAHAPDEYLDLDEFKKLIGIFGTLPLELGKLNPKS